MDQAVSAALRRLRSVSVLEAVRAALMSGEHKPGERLHEVRLATRLGVSRTPVRAAFQQLAAEGLLEYAPNRGFSVRDFPVAEVINAYEIRAVLEGLAARLAAERGLSREQLVAIEQALADGDALLARGSLQPGDRPAYGAVNAAIHEAIHAAAGSRMIGEMIALCQKVPLSSPRNVVGFEARDVRRRHDDHHRIVEAILAQ